MIQISDFYLKSLADSISNHEVMMSVGGFSGEHWGPNVDVRAFSKLLSQIVFGVSAEQSGRNQSVRAFVLKIIARGQSTDSTSMLSFLEIFEILKGNDFRILEGFNLKEVSSFATWIESSEVLTESTKHAEALLMILFQDNPPDMDFLMTEYTSLKDSVDA
jgi:hypothetical protein